jgi:hypothetical protein
MAEAVHSRIEELVRFARALQPSNTTIAMRLAAQRGYVLLPRKSILHGVFAQPTESA